ncbi:MAG: hypothetical protein E7611_08325 [Ruminococcaceae bacterium]|nr:hypothetical protein [Oscillospiraceae bacterium]
MGRTNNTEFYKKFQDWLYKQNKSSRTLSIEKLESEIGCKIPEKCTWSNSRNNTLSKIHLNCGFLVTEADNKLTFEYNLDNANAILNGKDMIILNNMYTGRYISSWGNLGHEAINLIRADPKTDEDKGKFYIWLNSMGICLEPIDNDTGCTVLMVRSINSTKYKVIAKAEGCRLCPGANISRSQNKHETDYDDKKIRHGLQKDLKVKYNNKCPMDDIYNEKDMFATFCADEVLETNCDVYLITKDSDEKEDESNHIYSADFKISEAMRAYIGANHQANKTLKEFLKKDVWKPIGNTRPEVTAPEFNFFKLIRKDKDELTLSNALAYFIDKVSIKTFLKAEFLKLDENFSDDKYIMFREKNNIDISFFGENNVIIIENKIDAGITAKASDKIQKQINDAVKLYHDKTKYTEEKYEEAITSVMRKICPDAFNIEEGTPEKHASQLSKYYIYAVAYLLNKDIKPDEITKHIKCFLLIPKYSEKNFKMMDCYLSDKYTPITYYNILDFFNNKENTANIDSEGKKYFDDFKSVLKSLAKEFDNELEEEMKYRFFDKIR